MPKTAKSRNLRRSRARCLCGLRSTLHFTTDNRKLTCEEARLAHPRASVRPMTFADLLAHADARVDALVKAVRS